MILKKMKKYCNNTSYTKNGNFKLKKNYLKKLVFLNNFQNSIFQGNQFFLTKNLNSLIIGLILDIKCEKKDMERSFIRQLKGQKLKENVNSFSSFFYAFLSFSKLPLSNLNLNNLIKTN